MGLEHGGAGIAGEDGCIEEPREGGLETGQGERGRGRGQ